MKPIVGPTTLTAMPGNDSFTLKQDPDHQHIDWTLGATSGSLPINDPAQDLTLIGDGDNDTVFLDYSNGSPLPGTLHLSGTFTLTSLQGTNPLAGKTLDIGRSTVFIRYGSSDPIAAIQSYLKNGYNAGAWSGTPTATTGVITSAAAQTNPNHTTAVGYSDSSDGQSVNTARTPSSSPTPSTATPISIIRSIAPISRSFWHSSTARGPGTREISTMMDRSTAPISSRCYSH